MLTELMNSLVKTVGEWGYPGIFTLMALESTVVPVPSELVMIPAGYLAFKGEMNLFWAIFAGVAGSLAGAFFNYFIAMWIGRPFLLRWGKYMLVKEHTLQKTEDFFARHGHISTFTGRLIPGVRHLISIPAGLARMNWLVFSIYTSLGAAIWCTILAVFGYYIGHNEAAIKEYVPLITAGLVAFVVVLILFYVRLKLKPKILS